MNSHDIYIAHQQFFNSNKTKDVDFIISQLKKLKHILKENEEECYKAIALDFNKSEFETYISEFALIYQELNLAIRKAKEWHQRTSVPTSLAHFPAWSYIIPEPLGTILVISPWNYPFYLSLVPVISSLVAGNTVILKPSELTSNASKAMAKLINENFPSDYLHVVQGGVEETTKLLKYKFDKIFFTGSSDVGRVVYEAAAKNLVPVTLELGGKSPVFVLKDADIQMTAKRVVWSKFLNAGQICVAPDYILVDKSVEDKLLEALKQEIEKHYDLEQLTENYVQIVNDRHFDRLSALIDSEKTYFGGKVDQPTRVIFPTILQNVSFEDEVMKDEIFGPILPVISFTDLDESIQQVKKRSKPLACYIYAKNRKLINKLLKEVSFGGGGVNDSIVHLSNNNLPFGGVGLSGFGSYHGKVGFNTFSHYKSILHKPFWFESNLKYTPYTALKKRVIRWFLE